MIGSGKQVFEATGIPNFWSTGAKRKNGCGCGKQPSTCSAKPAEESSMGRE